MANTDPTDSSATCQLIESAAGGNAAALNDLMSRHTDSLQGAVRRRLGRNLARRVDHDGNIQVTDFGLARIHTGDDLTMTGDIVGTLRYMSPEQLDGNTVADQRTDVYSLGLSLYELATGKAAFDAIGREQLLLQVQ